MLGILGTLAISRKSVSGDLGISGDLSGRISCDLEGAASLEILANLHRFAGIFRDL